MARTRIQSSTQTLPDAPPAGTQITLRVEEGGAWSALVEIPPPSGARGIRDGLTTHT